jgi:hypothetical protein
MRRDAARVLVRRARALLAAAEAMGGSAESIAAGRGAIERAEAERTDPTRMIETADAAVSEAMRALGAARAARPAPTEEEIASLVEAARTAGFAVERAPDGLAVIADGMFAGNAATITARRRIPALAALLAAHPHGIARVRSFPDVAGTTGGRLAAQRVRAAVAALVAEGVAADRLASEPLDVPPDGASGRVELVLVAYGT